MYISTDASERMAYTGPRCEGCNQPADPNSTGPDGSKWCWGCYPFPGYTPEGTATEDVLVAPPNAKDVTPALSERDEALDILRQAGLPAQLVATIAATESVQAERCYLHPESPTGYVGKGRTCQHRPGVTFTQAER